MNTLTRLPIDLFMQQLQLAGDVVLSQDYAAKLFALAGKGLALAAKSEPPPYSIPTRVAG